MSKDRPKWKSRAKDIEIPSDADSNKASYQLVRRRQGAKASAAASEAGRLMQQRRSALMTKEERSEMMAKCARAYWASMSPAERKIELRRRAKARKDNRRARIRAKLKGVQGGRDSGTGGLR